MHLRGACLGTVMLILTACSGSTPTPAQAEWTTPLEEEEGALLSVLSHGGDIWATGANGGSGGTVLRLHDGQWEREATNTQADLWWIAAHPDGDLYTVGSQGTVLRRDADANYSALESATEMTLYGVWFNSAGEGWIAAGDPLADGMNNPRGMLLHIVNGQVETESAVPASIAGHLMFKVWGPPGQSDVAYAVGDGGYMLQWNDDQWVEVDSGSSARLVTISGDASQRAIVGGTNQPTLLFDDGNGLMDISTELPAGAQGLNGVFVRDESLVVVGNLGFAALRDPDGLWTNDYVGAGGLGLHAVTIDDMGEIWAVGGNLLSLTQGYLAHYGTGSVPTID